ncbi:MAG: hypothetical protein IKU00_03380 [Bacteroidales bacterium]|nr:hypothetical protein [Bacteroidales bacterium]
MKEENEITEEVRQLLDSLEEHGRNVRRQKELSDLLDSLEAGTGTSLRAERSGARQSNLIQTKPVQVGLPRRSASSAPRNDAKRRGLYPLWWAIGAVAALLLLWLLAKPAMKKTPNIDEKILVEETFIKDAMTTQEEVEIMEETVILEEPVPEKLLAEETLVKPTIQKTKALKPTPTNNEEPMLAENTAIESTKAETIDTSNNIGVTTTLSSNEEDLSPLTFHLSPPQRRVIRSLNLVCYECKNENGELRTENFPFSVFRSPFEPDPNMKNGSLAFELKLH